MKKIIAGFVLVFGFLAYSHTIFAQTSPAYSFDKYAITFDNASESFIAVGDTAAIYKIYKSQEQYKVDMISASESFFTVSALLGTKFSSVSTGGQLIWAGATHNQSGAYVAVWNPIERIKPVFSKAFSGAGENVTGVLASGNAAFAISNFGNINKSTAPSQTMRWNAGGTIVNKAENEAYFTITELSPNLYAIGGRGRLIRFSTDYGATWTVGSPMSPYNGEEVHSITSGSGKIVAVGTNGLVMVNSGADRTKWTTVKVGSKDLNAVVHAEGVFMAVGNGGAAYSSNDGYIWKAVNMPTEVNLYGVAYASKGPMAKDFITIGEGGVVVRHPLESGSTPNTTPGTNTETNIGTNIGDTLNSKYFIEITEPTTGDVRVVGDTTNIRWNTNLPATTSLGLVLVNNKGSDVMMLTRGASKGSYTWTIPKNIMPNETWDKFSFRAVATDPNGKSVSGTSKNFSIAGENTVRYSTLNQYSNLVNNQAPSSGSIFNRIFNWLTGNDKDVVITAEPLPVSQKTQEYKDTPEQYVIKPSTSRTFTIENKESEAVTLKMVISPRATYSLGTAVEGDTATSFDIPAKSTRTITITNKGALSDNGFSNGFNFPIYLSKKDLSVVTVGGAETALEGNSGTKIEIWGLSSFISFPITVCARDTDLYISSDINKFLEVETTGINKPVVLEGLFITKHIPAGSCASGSVSARLDASDVDYGTKTLTVKGLRFGTSPNSDTQKTQAMDWKFTTEVGKEPEFKAPQISNTKTEYSIASNWAGAKEASVLFSYTMKNNWSRNLYIPKSFFLDKPAVINIEPLPAQFKFESIESPSESGDTSSYILLKANTSRDFKIKGMLSSLGTVGAKKLRISELNYSIDSNRIHTRTTNDDSLAGLSTEILFEVPTVPPVVVPPTTVPVTLPPLPNPGVPTTGSTAAKIVTPPQPINKFVLTPGLKERIDVVLFVGPGDAPIYVSTNKSIALATSSTGLARPVRFVAPFQVDSTRNKSLDTGLGYYKIPPGEFIQLSFAAEMDASDVSFGTKTYKVEGVNYGLSPENLTQYRVTTDLLKYTTEIGQKTVVPPAVEPPVTSTAQEVEITRVNVCCTNKIPNPAFGDPLQDKFFLNFNLVTQDVPIYISTDLYKALTVSTEGVTLPAKLEYSIAPSLYDTQLGYYKLPPKTSVYFSFNPTLDASNVSFGTKKFAVTSLNYGTSPDNLTQFKATNDFLKYSTEIGKKTVVVPPVTVPPVVVPPVIITAPPITIPPTTQTIIQPITAPPTLIEQVVIPAPEVSNASVWYGLENNGVTAPTRAAITFTYTLKNVSTAPLYINKNLKSTTVGTLSTSVTPAATKLTLTSIASEQAMNGDDTSYFVLPAGASRVFKVTGTVDASGDAPGIKDIKVNALYFLTDKNLSQKTIDNSAILTNLNTKILFDGKAPTTLETKVESPNGGETYKIGDKIILRWKATGLTSRTNSNGIAIYQAGVYPYKFLFSRQGANAVVNGQIQDNGSYEFVIPVGTTPGKYTAYVASVNGKDESDTTFTIAPAPVVQPPVGSPSSSPSSSPSNPPTTVTPTLKLNSPNGGGSYMTGSSVTITWSSVNIPASSLINIGLLNSSGAYLRSIGTVPNTGTYTWTIPHDVVSTGGSSTFKILISASSQSLSDGSDGVFTVFSSLTPPSTSPSSSPSSSPSGSPAVVQPPTLTLYCEPSPSNPRVGNVVTWYARVGGGTGSYSYSWFGSDNLSAGTNLVSKTYSTTGTKAATVVVTSGTQQTSASCSVTVSTASDTNTNPSSSPSGSASPSSSGVSRVGGTSSNLIANVFYRVGDLLDTVF